MRSTPVLTDRPGIFSRVSQGVVRAEMALGGGLVAVIFMLLLANVASRALGRPLIWTDELAVHLMVWLAFIGASVGIAHGDHMAIDLLSDRLSPKKRLWLTLGIDVLVLAFLGVISGIVWLWLDPIGLLRAGSGTALARDTYNFVYTNPTLTLGVRKIWFWLIVPLCCLTGILHCFAALLNNLTRCRAGQNTAIS